MSPSIPFLLLLLISPGGGLLAQTDEEAPQAAWSRRARWVDGTVEADPAAVETAVAAYRRAVERRPDDPLRRAHLLRALDFQGQYLIAAGEAQREHYASAREIAEEGFRRLAERRAGGPSGDRPLDELSPERRAAELRKLGASAGWSATDLAALHFWGAVVWGQWGDRVGRLKAAREGVADELRALAGTALELDATYADAGPHRFLGRLHAEAPHIPFITGWVDRDLAIRHLSRAVEMAPDEPANGLFLAEALLEHRPRQRERALEWLRHLAAREPRPGHLLGDYRTLTRARQLAREQLARER